MHIRSPAWIGNPTCPSSVKDIAKAKEIVRDLGRYWWETAPEGKAFRRHDAIRLAVGMARRYEVALCRIAKESPECRQIAMDALGFRSMDQVVTFRDKWRGFFSTMWRG